MVFEIWSQPVNQDILRSPKFHVIRIIFVIFQRFHSIKYQFHVYLNNVDTWPA